MGHQFEAILHSGDLLGKGLEGATGTWLALWRTHCHLLVADGVAAPETNVQLHHLTAAGLSLLQGATPLFPGSDIFSLQSHVTSLGLSLKVPVSMGLPPSVPVASQPSAPQQLVLDLATILQRL